jgi:hypothetical protein
MLAVPHEGVVMDWRDLPDEPSPRGGEAEMLQFALDRVRRQFAWKHTGHADTLREAVDGVTGNDPV